MKKQNLLSAFAALAMALTVGLACKSLSTQGLNQNSGNPASSPIASNAATGNSSTASNVSGPAAKAIDNPGLEKPDFTMTSEDLDKDFTGPNATSKSLEKYSNKYIAVTGRVTMLVLEKKGTTQPWVTLYAPGTLGGVNCYFDDDKVAQMKLLTEDKIAKVQGFQDDFVVPKVSPMLKHCAVLEAH